MASSLCLVLAVIKQECQFFAKPFLFAFSFKDGRRKPYHLVKGFRGVYHGLYGYKVCQMPHDEGKWIEVSAVLRRGFPKRGVRNGISKRALPSQSRFG